MLFFEALANRKTEVVETMTVYLRTLRALRLFPMLVVSFQPGSDVKKFIVTSSTQIHSWGRRRRGLGMFSLSDVFKIIYTRRK